ncbi:hypothetical protein SmJEL517_g02562 [Synchytrium microbalum]|uniref:protein kinase C n=1 Tax=Synchytrium microbalum TaxID=1806994 RepID=A0A507CA72_9FUNG|nr:uncharacterized protein SmJEL517_g02562 [Synchytrium microbalum]TPX34896.1 hypothetical protein SmJEL517_g02562 [Synchytrium microbalum]
MESSDPKLRDIEAKIEKEKRVIKGAEQMLSQLKDQNALEQCQVTVSEAQRRLEFLEGEYKRMNMKKRKATSVDVLTSSSLNSVAPSETPTSTTTDASSDPSPASITSSSNGGDKSPAFISRATALFRSTHQLNSPGSVRRAGTEVTSSQPNLSQSASNFGGSSTLQSSGGSIMLSNANMGGANHMFSSFLSNLGLNKSGVANSKVGLNVASQDNLAPPPVSQSSKVLSSFDYLRHETAISAEQVKYKLKSVEQKLDVEQKVKAGTEKLYQAVIRDPEQDKRRQQEVAAKKEEADARVQILNKAVQRYKGLYVADDEDDDEEVVEQQHQAEEAETVPSLVSKPDTHSMSDMSTIPSLNVEGTGDSSPPKVDSATVNSVSDKDEHSPSLAVGGEGSTIISKAESVGNLKPAASSDSPLSGDDTEASLNRKTMTGRLRMKLLGANNLPGKISHKTETYAIVRIDGAQRAKTRANRSRWAEDLDIVCDKATECEIAVYEKGGTILALVWFRIAELEDAKKIKSSGVVMTTLVAGGLSPGRESTATTTTTNTGHHQSATDVSNIHTRESVGGESVGSHQTPVDKDGSGDITPAEGAEDSFKDELWLDMEPAGQLCVRLSFMPEQRVLRRRNEGVMRRKPVQRGKVMRGHKFVPINTYSVMKCAICMELFVNSGYQCSWCKYACHKKCYSRAITKCITKGDQEEKGDEEEEDGSDLTSLALHKIPHRFEPFTNIGTNWCCHCGQILAIGRGKALKCTECSFSCHKECMPLVPNLCGLSPDVAFQIVQAVDTAEKVRSGKNNNNIARLPRDDSSNIIPPSSSHTQLKYYGRDNTAASSQEIDPSSFATTMEKMPPSASNLSRVVGPAGESRTSETALPPPPIPQQQHTPQLEARDSVTTSTVTAAPSTAKSTTPLVPSSTVAVTEKQQVANQTIMGAKGKGSAAAGGPPYTGPKGIGLEDFQFLAVLGKGNFGKVMLAEDKYTKSLYAIKVLKKQFILENDEVERQVLMSEKRVFLIANKERHPFLVNLHSCFQTESRIYFVMEYVSGGDLMWHIQKQQFSEKRAKFYACEVLLALEYFHRNNIVYRDLKLDNILLTLDGHIKIADYGLCKEGMPYGSTTSTFCGTPEFMAPEILQDKPYGKAVDWWALGVLIYEMLLGQSPFRGEDEDEIFEAILEDDILYPVTMQRDAVTLLQKLLCKDPSKRLGSSKADAEDIKKHPFFKGVDWDAMLTLKVPPPFYPTVASPTDVSNFDEEFTREMPQLTPCTSTLTATDQEEFRGFTYISDWAMEERKKHGFMVPPPREKRVKESAKPQ